jgi:PhnB protein
MPMKDQKSTAASNQMNDQKSPAASNEIVLTPYLICRNAARAIEFYVQAFGALEDFRLMQDDGRVGHAELRIGGARFSVADEFPELGFKSPQSYGGSPITLHLYVPDVDAFVARARAARAEVLAEPEDAMYGDRIGRLADPSGHHWMIATKKVEVPPEEIQRRMRGTT